jgi:hypothetical protein
LTAGGFQVRVAGEVLVFRVREEVGAAGKPCHRHLEAMAQEPAAVEAGAEAEAPARGQALLSYVSVAPFRSICVRLFQRMRVPGGPAPMARADKSAD